MATFIVEASVSTSLNFLIYVQNLYLSQKELGKNRFPSYRVPFSVFHENFEDQFRVLWNSVVDLLEQSDEKDWQRFDEQKELFVQQLFNRQAVSMVKFEDIYRTFHNWWGSFAGGFAIERAVSDKISQLASELTVLDDAPASKLIVSILYDDCLFVTHKKMPNLIIISVPEIHLRYTDVVARMLVQ